MKVMMRMDILTLPYANIIKSAGEVDDISKYTSPLKLFEYMSHRKAIIASNLPVLKEVLNSKNSILQKFGKNQNFTKNRKNFAKKKSFLKIFETQNFAKILQK